MSHPCATMSVWASAWLHGSAAADDVLDALHAWAPAHEVLAADDTTGTALDLPAAGSRPAGLAFLLAGLRRVGAQHPRLVLPVPGDVRGLPGTGSFSRSALAHGAALVLHESGIGLVCEPLDGSALTDPEVLRWTVHTVPSGPPPEQMSLAEADQQLRSAVREATEALTSMDVARHRSGVREQIAEAVRGTSALSWPDQMPGRAAEVLARAAEVEAILDLASQDPHGSAVSNTVVQARADALRPLRATLRGARIAAINSAVAKFRDQANRQ